MMRVVGGTGPLIDQLPEVRGRYRAKAAMSGMTWFRVGGAAEVLFKPADVQDLMDFLREKPDQIPVTIIGVASNLLVRDGGIKGVVVRLGRAFANIEVGGNGLVRVGAGALCINTALTACEAGLTGLEFMRGVPGTIGGGLRMNAGAYGAEFKDVVVEATAVDAKGDPHVLSTDDLAFSYRHSGAPEDWIFIEAVLRTEPGDMSEISARMADINRQREDSQPMRVRTGGSTFKNPPGQKAWELIDAAGCRGLRHGGARMSEKHCNFLINEGNATAEDLETLGEEVRRRVFEHSGVELDWEIDRVGVPKNAPLKEVKT
jgi:UDP-N-acetylmuramate dehydrogenase